MIIVVFVFVNVVFEVCVCFVVLHNRSRGDLVGFYEKFLRRCNDLKKTPTKVLQELKMPISLNTGWANGRNPRPSTLIKLADYFGCTVDDLKPDALNSKEPADVLRDPLAGIDPDKDYVMVYKDPSGQLAATPMVPKRDELPADALEVARAYMTRSYEVKNVVRAALGLSPLSDEKSKIG